MMIMTGLTGILRVTLPRTTSPPVDQNAVLLTYGDNDSFPLWYIQDVEGYRTDVRVANLSYLQSGFYIETMSRKAWESDALPFTLPVEKYIEGERVQLPIRGDDQGTDTYPQGNGVCRFG
jgi:hypothetical protein